VNDDAIRDVVVGALHEIAPEVDADALPGEADLREELELDSMDFLNFVTALHEGLGVDVPERDYPLLGSIDACVRYVSGRLGERGE
jgi:acyl carrier protein